MELEDGSKLAERGRLTIVGTGLLAAGHMTPESQSHLRAADKVFYVVADPVTRMWIEAAHPDTESLEDAYAPGKSRTASYREMTERLLAEVRRGRRICAVFYGHPGVFVDASHAAIRQARAEGYAARMLPAVSAEDCLIADLGVDPAADGWHSYEATDFLLRRRADPTSPLILWQIGAIAVDDIRLHDAAWNQHGIEILAEVLQRTYPADHPVTIYEAPMLAVRSPHIDTRRLDTLTQAAITVASTLYVPPGEHPEVDREMAERLGIRGA